MLTKYDMIRLLSLHNWALSPPPPQSFLDVKLVNQRLTIKMFSKMNSQQQITVFCCCCCCWTAIGAFKIRNHKRNKTCLDFLRRVTNWWDLRLRHDDYAICYTPHHTSFFVCVPISQLWRLTRSQSIDLFFSFDVSAFVSFRKVICFVVLFLVKSNIFLIIIIKHSCQCFIKSSESKERKKNIYANWNLITKHDDFNQAPIAVLFVVFHQLIFNSERFVIYLVVFFTI